MSFRRNRAERKIKKIRRQLEQLNEEETPDILRPVEETDSTMVIRTREQQKADLMEKLAKYEAILAECKSDEEDSPEERKVKAKKRIAELQREMEDIDLAQDSALDQPIEGTASTIIVQANREKRQELQEEMAYCKKVIEDGLVN